MLNAYVESGLDRLFDALVQKHAGMVFGAALRVTRNRELAEDTAQWVFAILHRKARALVGHPCLAAWLHKTATLEASRLMRKERNHQRKLKRLAAASEGERCSCAVAHPALEYLDEAMAMLGSGDRQLLMMRFYQGYKLGELASELDRSEVAIRKQSERAIARLAKILSRRGVALSTTALAGVLASALVESSPAEILASITHEAAVASASVPQTTLILNTLQTMTYGKQIALTAAAVALLAAIPIGIQNHRLGEAKAMLQQAEAAMISMPSPLSTSKRTAASFLPPQPILEPNSLRAQAAASGSTDADFLRDLLTRQVRPRLEDIAAFIGENRSLPELRSMFDEVVDLPLSEHQRSALRKLVMEIGRHDGQYAVELASKSIEATALRHHAVGAAYAGWASRDPAEAWAYATALPPKKRAGHPYWQIMMGAAEGELSADEFYHFVESHSPGVLRLSSGHLWHALASVYDHKDSSGMPSWVEGLPSGPLRNLASSQLVQRWALSDPPAARAWMDANVNPHDHPEPTLLLAKAWVQVDPHAAMDWLTSLPPELQTQEQYSGALEKWLSYDQIGAANWLVGAEPTPFLDIPFERYVDRVRHANPPEAMTWAKSITDSEHRLRVMKKVATVWRRKDPAGLEQFLATDPAGERLR